MVKKKSVASWIIGISVLLTIAGCASTSSEAPVSVPASEPAPTSSEPQAEETGTDMSAYEREGFAIVMEDGRLWVFHEGSDDYKKFLETGEPARQVVRPAAGPGGITLKSTDSDTINEYLYTLPGFFARMEDGRLWIFKTGTPDLEQFLASGEPARQVVRPGAGPDGITIKAVDAAIIDEYMAAYQASK